MSELTPEARAVAAVHERIDRAAERAGRDPAGVLLVGATKTVPPDRIQASGLAHAGENKVQELLAKQEALPDIRWHFIGRLQRNKVRHIAGRVELVHSVDSVALAQEIAKRGPQRVLIEVNVSKESSKGGVAVDALDDLLELSTGVAGLMTIPAPGDERAARRAFRTLRALADERGLEHCSMGMSDDFEIAVEEGATIVRVGAAIFGARPG